MEQVINLLDTRPNKSGDDFERKVWDYVGKHLWFGIQTGDLLLKMAGRVRSKMSEGKSDAAATAKKES